MKKVVQNLTATHIMDKYNSDSEENIPVINHKNLVPIQLEDYTVITPTLQIQQKQRLYTPQLENSNSLQQYNFKCSFKPRLFHDNKEKLLDGRFINNFHDYDKKQILEIYNNTIQQQKEQQKKVADQDFENCQFKRLARIKRKLLRHK